VGFAVSECICQTLGDDQVERDKLIRYRWKQKDDERVSPSGRAVVRRLGLEVLVVNEVPRSLKDFQVLVAPWSCRAHLLGPPKDSWPKCIAPT
jgi:hypothetical protein